MIRLSLDGNLPQSWKNQRLGLVMHPASINSNYESTFELLRGRGYKIRALFGPQHGIFGQTQDNMIEWEGFKDPETGVLVYSLYGTHRTPTQQMLEGLDRLVIDLQDVGARYYTFIWTMLNCMRAAFDAGIAVSIIDRPNPINAKDLEGPILDMNFATFVGLAPIPVRHGFTMGELARFCKSHFQLDGDLEVLPVEGLKRNMYFPETKLPWVFPSPNIPHFQTAVVYPGGCLLEATNISEGRGTTLPFELVGAPYIKTNLLMDRLNSHALKGVHFRPVHFQPTFHKWSGQICHGVHVHVTNKDDFKSFSVYTHLIREIATLFPEGFEWLQPPYEYEWEKMPIDILSGNSDFRTLVEAGDPIQPWLDQSNQKAKDFGIKTEEFKLYD